MRLTFEDKINQGIYPSKDELYDLFIRQNLSRDNICKKFGFSSKVFKKLTSYYNIKKDFSLIKENMEKTSIEKYGIPDGSVRPEAIQKRKETCLAKYGKTTNLGTPETELKSKKTSLERYGVERACCSKESRQKFQKTMQKRYGVNNYLETNLSDEAKIYLSNKDKMEEMLSLYKEKPSIPQIAERLHCAVSTIQQHIQKWNLGNYINKIYQRSSSEQELVNFIKSLKVTIELNKRDLLPSKKEIDIYLPKYKIGIEFNGDYWHSNLMQEKQYHFNKSIEAEKVGIHLIHIYEYEWKNEDTNRKIKQMLKIALGKVDKKIYARKCKIKLITNKEASQLNNEVHLQGHRDAQITYGLFYKDSLVQLMSFSKTKYNKNLKTDNSWEIIRGCPGSNNIVVGGVSKLFHRFVSDYHPEVVFSYCDYNKFNGKSYEKIGMKMVGFTGPDKTLFIQGKAIKRNPKKYREYKNKVDMVIWGAGSKKYIWNAPK